jgi:outer membrane protein
MKKLLLCLLVFIWIPSWIYGQNDSTKIRYADVEYIFSKLPAAKQVESELKSLQKQLETKYQTKYDEFNKKYTVYVEKRKTLPDTVRLATEQELQLLQESLEKFQQDSQVTLQRKQEQLLEPVTKDIQAAIEAVAKEKGYTFILNAGVGSQDMILHADAAMDISALVLQKLGLPEGPEPQRH